MRRIIYKVCFTLIICLLSSVVFAQEKNLSYYNRHESEILPDARETFRAGDYDRVLVLCNWYRIIMGDDAANALRASAGQCAELYAEMTTLYADGKISEALEVAMKLLAINPDDPEARRIKEELAEPETPPNIEEFLPLQDTIATPESVPQEEVIPEVVQEPTENYNYIIYEPVPAPKRVTSKTDMFLLLNMGYSMDSGVNAGLSLGKPGRFGWYGKVMSTFAVPQNVSHECDEKGFVNGIMPVYTGMASTFKVYGVAGLIVGFGIPVYLNVGAGYGFRKYDWELDGGSWVRNVPGSYSGVAIDAGVIGSVDRFAFSAGATYLAKTIDVCLGVGFLF